MQDTNITNNYAFNSVEKRSTERFTRVSKGINRTNRPQCGWCVTCGYCEAAALKTVSLKGITGNWIFRHGSGHVVFTILSLLWTGHDL